MIHIADLLSSRSMENLTLVRGRWVPARRHRLLTLADRVRDAWAVFVGRAEAVTWEEVYDND